MDLLKASTLLQGFRQVVFNKQHCTRSISPRSQCSWCSDVCPVNGLRLTSEGVIIEDCIGCGLCVGACPGQAMVLPAINWFGRKLDGAGDKVYYHCQKVKAESQATSRGVTVPCLGAIPVETMVSVAANFSAVYFYHPQCCSQCEIKNGLSLFEDNVKGAKRLLQLFNADDRLIVHSNEAFSGYLPKQEVGQVLNRRGFFSMIALNVRKAPAAIIEVAAPVSDPVLSVNQPNRRRELVSAIKRLAVQAGGALPEQLPVISHQIERPCYLCGACAKLCPAGALRLNEAEVPILEVNLSLCMACNLCQDICPQRAIAFSSAGDTQDLLSENFKVLAAGEQKKCPNCGADYVGNYLAEVCLRCRFAALRREF
ncbi:MAG: 4Fe-4S dicluster domain-containing protein [Bacillota bacterium]